MRALSATGVYRSDQSEGEAGGFMQIEVDFHSYPIFSALSEAEQQWLLEQEGVQIKEYERSEAITEKCVCCVISGTAAVYSMREEDPCLLRYLNAGDIFGVAGFFAPGNALSSIEAKSDAVILTVSGDVIRQLIDSSEGFRYAYLTYLSGRIAFLNRKIDFITAGTAQSKLITWILGNGDRDEFDIPVSMSDLARILDMGRASLYRAFDELTEQGIIAKNGGHIRILDKGRLANGY